MRRAPLLLGLLLAGCDGSMGVDAGGGDLDAATTDGGGDVDAGAGPDDAGPAPDAGGADAGGADAGAADAGAVDGGATDAGGGSDAGPLCAPDLAPLDDGSGVSGGVGLPDLVLSEIAPGMFIELFNTTADPLALNLSPFQLCSPVDYVALSSAGAGVVVPPRGYAVVPWPASFTDTAAGGEVLLYRDTAFESGGSILDFVCWGTNPHETRRTLAITSGKWQLGCAPALGAGSIARRVATTGLRADHYDTTSPPSPMSCAP